MNHIEAKNIVLGLSTARSMSGCLHYPLTIAPDQIRRLSPQIGMLAYKEWTTTGTT